MAAFLWNLSHASVAMAVICNEIWKDNLKANFKAFSHSYI